MNNITILVIDDEPSNIQLIIDILQNADFECKILSSSNSKLALEIAFSVKPSIIITDWEMPEMTGIELILELDKNENTKEIPVIMASGVKMTPENLKLALDSGAFDFIRKPIDEIELIARINSAIRFVKYYNQKAESEKTISKFKEEKFQYEIDLQKKELLSKTMILLKINQAYEKYKEDLNSFAGEKCKPDCKAHLHAQNFSQAIISTTSKQIWVELEQHFEQIHEDFYKNLLFKFPDLTKNERKLCAYLRLNLSTKDIASLTFQSIRSIEISRTRLREKLGLKRTEEDLNAFMLNF